MLPTDAASEPAPCIVSATFPPRAFVGEQIVLRRRILRRPEVSSASWIDGSSFPGFRSDPLPGLSGETRAEEQGAAYLVFEERHALFPVRAGRLTIPAARLQCTLHTLPSQSPRAYHATTTPGVVEVIAPPVEGRPEDYAGLVGEVRVAVSAAPQSMALGSSLHVLVSLEGDADLRDARPPFGGGRTLGGAELFAARPKLVVDPGERLRLRRSYSLELVPRQAGIFEVPAVRVPFFDPRTRRYGVAESESIRIRVNPASGS
jgi:hypothetical protein